MGYFPPFSPTARPFILGMIMGSKKPTKEKIQKIHKKPRPEKPLLNKKQRALAERLKQQRLSEKKSDNPSSFELVIQVRDGLGQPTGKTKTIRSDNQEDLDSFWNRNGGIVVEKKKKRTVRQKEDSLKDRIKNDLEKLTKLERGWDGKDGLPFNSVTYQKALEILAGSHDLIKFKPKIVATSLGSARLEFANRDNQKELDIEFVDEYFVRYYFYDPADNFSEEKQFGSNEIWRVRELLTQLMK